MATGTISAGAELLDLIAENSSIVTATTATDTLIQELSIPGGYNLVLISMTFRAINGTGARKVMSSINDESTKKNLAEMPPTTTGFTTITTFTTYRVGVPFTLKLWANQSSGSNMDVQATTQVFVFN